MAKSVYIHIPFCKQKCKYCSFISFSCIDRKQEYIYALLNDIDINYKGENLKTLYFGGGTPSLFEIQDIKKIIDKFNFLLGAEITFEMNPDDASLEYLQGLKEIGINRLSIGAQTFKEDILNIIGRRHNSSQIIQAVKFAQEVGFKNISLDLIYGLPNQTIQDLIQDLEIITKLGIQHVSTYGLKIEETSLWGKFLPNNLPDDDEQADMYMLVNNYLCEKGYNRYEISNFAIKGYESKHNLNYWDNDEYYGFGIAAHGYINGVRYSKQSILELYLNNPSLYFEEQVQTLEEKLEEEIFLGFRKAEGINVSSINQKFGIDFEKKYYKVLRKYCSQYIEKTAVGYKLTIEGVLLSNNILAEFLE